MSIADNLLAFTFAATLLTLTPGLDTALILRTATVEGRQQAFRAALGDAPFRHFLRRSNNPWVRGVAKGSSGVASAQH